MWAPEGEEGAHAQEKDASKPADWRESREGCDSSSGSATELSSLLPLSSLLSTLNPPSPLLAAFLATRRELPGAVQMPGIDDGGSTSKTPNNEDRGVATPRLECVRTRHHHAKHLRRFVA